MTDSICILFKNSIFRITKMCHRPTVLIYCYSLQIQEFLDHVPHSTCLIRHSLFVRSGSVISSETIRSTNVYCNSFLTRNCDVMWHVGAALLILQILHCKRVIYQLSIRYSHQFNMWGVAVPSLRQRSFMFSFVVCSTGEVCSEDSCK